MTTSDPIARIATAPVAFDTQVDVLVVGAGAAGLTAALAAADGGASVLLVERDASPSGSTALSSGLIPAPGTRWQRAANIDDSVALMVDDIMAKARGLTDRAYATRLVETAGPALEWLSDSHDVPFEVLQNFNYPGHSALRMHGHPDRTGRALMHALLQAANAAQLDIVTDATVDTLVVDSKNRITGVTFSRPDGLSEGVGCAAVILACNGYGGNPALVRAHMPAMADALYFGHTGNQGHAIMWADALDLECADLGAFQGHGSVASPHGILITWAVMMEGGVQINVAGERFSNEHAGYSEQAANVLRQPRQVAWNVYDGHCHAVAQQFEDYRDAEAMGAVIRAESLPELAEATRIPIASLQRTFAQLDRSISAGETDSFGRSFKDARRLDAPYYATKVTGALFHTQGGLVVDADARALQVNGTPMPNLYAAGGAARGISGPSDWGYLSGNGLLSAISLGRIAGLHASGTPLPWKSTPLQSVH